MSAVTRASDTVYALRFLRLLTTPWNKTTAYERGIVDENGKQLKKMRNLSKEDRTYYNLFHRLVFNIKRLINKVPLVGRHIVTSYAAALLMLRENTELTENEILLVLREAGIDADTLTESYEILCTGRYSLRYDFPEATTGEEIFREDDALILEEGRPVGEAFGAFIYRFKHEGTGLSIDLTRHDVRERWL